MLELSNEQFAEEHLSINKLKKSIIDKLIALVMYTVNEEIYSFTKNKTWFEEGQLKVKLISKMLKHLTQNSPHDLSKNVLAYCLKQVESSVLTNMKNKRVKTEVFGFLIADVKSLLKEFGD